MKLYIGGISPEVTESELMDLYSQYGKVKKVDLLKDENGVNRGYAFIEMEEEMDGESAILGTNNTLMGGTNIQVSVSRSRLDQKRERQKQNKVKNNKFKKNNKPNNFRNPKVNNQKNNFEDSSEDKYNRKSAPIQKGLDYGRTSSSPQMSFLGQEGFATSLRTVDTLHSSNTNFKRNEGNYYRKNNNRRNTSNNNYNNRRGPSNFRKNYNKPQDRKVEENKIFSNNTSDIIGNLE